MRALPIRVWVGLPLLMTVLAADARAGEPAEAEDRSPSVILRLASFDATLDLFRTVSDDEEWLSIVKAPAEKVSQAGADLSRPIGILFYGVLPDVPEDEQSTLRRLEYCSALVLIPVDDLGKLLAALGESWEAERTEGPEADGGYRLVGERATWHLIRREGWAILASDQEHLRALPDDPLDVFQGLDQRYTFVARVDPQRAMPDHWQQFRADIAPDPDRAVMKAVRELLPMWPEFLETYLELETYRLVGETLDDVETALFALTREKTGDIRQDLAFSARDATVTAERFEALRGAKSRLAGLHVPESLLVLRWTIGLRDEDATALAAPLEKMDLQISADRCEELGLEAEKIKRLLKALTSTAAATIRGRVLDGAMVCFDDEPLCAVFVMSWAGAQTLEEPLVDLLDSPGLLSEETPSTRVHLEEYRGVPLRGLRLPNESLVFGLAEDTLYFGIGDDCVNALKRVIDHGRAPADSPVPVLEVRVNPRAIGSLEERLALGPLVEAASAMVPFDPGSKRSPLTFRVLVTPDGLSLRTTFMPEVVLAGSREEAEGDEEAADGGESPRHDTAPKAAPAAAQAD